MWARRYDLHNITPFDALSVPRSRVRCYLSDMRQKPAASGEKFILQLFGAQIPGFGLPAFGERRQMCRGGCLRFQSTVKQRRALIEGLCAVDCTI